MDISRAVASGNLNERPFEPDTHAALYDEFEKISELNNETAANLGKYIYTVQQYHAHRVAYFVEPSGNNPDLGWMPKAISVMAVTASGPGDVHGLGRYLGRISRACSGHSLVVAQKRRASRVEMERHELVRIWNEDANSTPPIHRCSILGGS